MAIRHGANLPPLRQDYPPLRTVANWNGTNTVYRCDVCGCGVTKAHAPGGEECRELQAERRAKCAD